MSTINGKPISFHIFLDGRLLGVAQSIPGDVVEAPPVMRADCSFSQKLKPTCHRKKVQIKRMRRFVEATLKLAEANRPR